MAFWAPHGLTNRQANIAKKKEGGKKTQTQREKRSIYYTKKKEEEKQRRANISSLEIAHGEREKKEKFISTKLSFKRSVESKFAHKERCVCIGYT